MTNILFVRGKTAPAWEAAVLRGLNRIGYQAKFLVSRSNSSLEPELQLRGTNLSTSNFIESSMNKSSLNRILNYVLNVKTSEFTTRYLRASELFNGWDIAHLTDDYYTPGLQAAKYVKNIVMTVWENVPLNYSIINGFPARKLRGLMFDKVKRFFPVTEESKEYLVSSGVKPDRMEVIHPGIDTKQFKEEKVTLQSLRHLKDQGRPIILGVARIEYAKGLTYTMRALRELKKERSDFIYLHVGGGSARFSEYLSRMVKAFDLEENVGFVGRVDYQRMPEYYSAAEVFLLPSIPTLPWEEQMGFSVLEAMACNRCVLVSDLPSLKEVVPNDVGLRFSPGNYRDMYQKISDALSDENLRERSGKSARKHVISQFNSEITAKKYAAAYSSL